MPLSNTQYDELMRSYQDRQLARNRLINTRREEVEARSARMAELDAEIARLGVAEARRRLHAETPSGADSSAAEENAARASAPEGCGYSGDLVTRIEALAKEKQALLLSLGFPADYLDPPYGCPDCRDTGYIGSERCHCFKQAAIDLVYGKSGRSALYERECFDRFRLDYYPEDIIDRKTGISARAAAKTAFEKCVDFVKEFDTSFRNLFLFGDTGVGKTFLCNCIAGELIRSGHSVVYFSADRLFGALADHAFGRSSQSEADYRSIFDCDLLIIDDLGTEMTNSFTLSQFFVCLNERILHERSTVISSNLSLSDISAIYSERIFSRISSSFTLLRLFGKDIRVSQRL